MPYSLIVFLLIGYSYKVSSSSQECSDIFMELNLVTHRAQNIGTKRIQTKLNDEVRLLEEYQINCSSTTITSVLLGADLRIRTELPSIQIWRPESVTSNNYNVIPGSERVIYFTTSNTSTSGVFEYPLNPPITISRGELLAVKQPPDRRSTLRLYYIQGISFRSYTVAFETTSASLGNNPTHTDQLILVYPITDGYCIDSQVTPEIIKENALQIHETRVRDNRQYIYPEMKFSCNGSIIKWIYGGEYDQTENDLPELQIWRELGVDEYNKIGSSRVDANNQIGTNLYEFTPQSPLEFQEGDIFGVHIPSEAQLTLHQQRESGPRNLVVTDAEEPLSFITSPVEEVNDFPLVTAVISANINDVTTSSTFTLQSNSDTSTTTTRTNGGFMITSSLMSSSDMSSLPPSFNASNDAVAVETSIGIAIPIIIIITILVIGVISAILVFVYIIRKRKLADETCDLPSERTKQNRHDAVNNPLYEQDNSVKLKTNAVQASFYAEAGMIPPNCDKSIHQMEPVQVIPKEKLEWGVVVPTMAQRTELNNNMRNDNNENIYSIIALTSPIYQLFESEYNHSSFFTESEIYWAPGSDCGSIYEQLAEKRYREIIRGQITIKGHLGSGQFGQVAKGTWKMPRESVNVAIKTLNDDISEDEKVKFLQEAAIMGQFHHPNIVKLHGVVTVGEPVMIILEFMKNGDMKKYLETLRPMPGEMVPSTLFTLLLSFCRQIASGMEYLSKKCFVHRDLAARNILVTEDQMCKISDFGLSRDLHDENYYVSKGGQIPVKWTAPEAITYKKYSSASDVWSFGVLMFEIWSLGHKPFEGMSNQEAFRKVCNGYRLPPPPGCSKTVYEMMIQCWHYESSIRPTFANLVMRLSQPEWSINLWTKHDKAAHHQAINLGAPLEAGQSLYTELQNLYIADDY